MPLTKNQAHLIAQLINEVRPNDWTYKRVMGALEANAANIAPFGVIAQAAVNAAMTPAMTSPDQIFQPGPHWPTTNTSSAPRPAARPSCKAHIGHPADTCPVCTSEIAHGTRKWSERGKPVLGSPPPPNFRDMIAQAKTKPKTTEGSTA